MSNLSPDVQTEVQSCGNGAPRLSPKCNAILQRLRRGPVTNIELIEIGGYRACARVHELRKKGFKIHSAQIKGGVWEYELGDRDGIQA